MKAIITKFKYKKKYIIKILFKKHFRTSIIEIYTSMHNSLKTLKYILEFEQSKQIYKIVTNTLESNSKQELILKFITIKQENKRYTV